MNLQAYWETRDGESRIWLRDNDSINTPGDEDPRIGTLSVVEALRLRDSLTTMIEHCVKANLKEAEKDLDELKEQQKRAKG